MFSACLSEHAGPWVHMSRVPIGSMEAAGNMRVIQLDGTRMTTLDDMFDEFQRKARFPSYFGRNANALLEVLTDMAWMPASGYVWIIRSSDSLLVAESNDTLACLVECLQDAGEEWSKPVKLGEWWDRDPVPFHAVFVSGPDGYPAFRQRLADTGLLVDELPSNSAIKPV